MLQNLKAQNRYAIALKFDSSCDVKFVDNKKMGISVAKIGDSRLCKIVR